MHIQEYILVGTFAFAFTVAMILAAMYFFPKWGLMDRPKNYGLTREPIPYYGGLAMFSAFLISVIVFVPLSLDIIGVLIAASLLVLVSFLDDRYGLSPFLRLAIHILAAAIVVLTGVGIHSISNPFGDPITLDSHLLNIPGLASPISLFSAIFTIIWVVLVVNTVNFLDGLNGLTSGVVAIAAFFLFVLSIMTGHIIDQTSFSVISLIVFFVALAFTLFDFAPAKILMGDTGSVFLGFMLAIMAIFSGGKVATVFLVMGVPILDAFWVIARRIKNKKSPFRGDLLHLHHRLKDTGLSERTVVLFIYFLTAIFGFLAISVGTMGKLIVAGILTVLMIVMAVYLTFFVDNKSV